MIRLIIRHNEAPAAEALKVAGISYAHITKRAGRWRGVAAHKDTGTEFDVWQDGDWHVTNDTGDEFRHRRLHKALRAAVTLTLEEDHHEH